MATIDPKKIDGALKQLENAAKAALKVLNDATDNSLADSPYAEFPLQSVGPIGILLQKLSDEAKSRAKYAGLSDEQIAEQQAAEQAAELEELKRLNDERLAELTKPAEPATEADSEPTGEEIGNL